MRSHLKNVFHALGIHTQAVLTSAPEVSWQYGPRLT